MKVPRPESSFLFEFRVLYPLRAMPMSDNTGVCVLRSYACRETDPGQKHHYERRTEVSQAFLLEDVVGLV